MNSMEVIGPVPEGHAYRKTAGGPDDMTRSVEWKPRPAATLPS
jgi:hypothetical protein